MSEPNSPTPTGAGTYTMVTKPASLDAPSAGMSHEEDVPGAQPESVRAGHEPDWFDARGVIFVPILITVAAALTYGMVTGLFAYFTPGKSEQTGNAQAVADNAKPYNERVTRINSQDPKADVKQPRLEWMKAVEQREGEPVYYRSLRAADKGNAPELRPESLRAENFVDWNTGKRPLVSYEWVDKGKGVARIPVAEAMKILIEGKKLPAKEGAGPAGTMTNAKLSNGGHAIDPKDVPKVEAKKDAGHGHDKKEKH